MNIAICDDDKEICIELERLIKLSEKELNQSYEIVNYQSGRSLCNDITNGKNFDLVFLDIDMPDMDGIEVGKEIEKFSTLIKIIYVTNYSDYMNQAYLVHAYGYLTKPIKEEEIKNSICDVVRYFKESGRLEEEFIFVNSKDGRYPIPCKDIMFIESKGHKIIIKTSDNSYDHTTSMTQILSNIKSKCFYRSHKSYLVNMNYVQKVSGYEIFLLNGEKVTLAQKKAKKFKSDFNSYLHANTNKRSLKE